MTDQIEMFWKCSTCGTINGGLSKKCGERIVKGGRVVPGTIGGCGKAQDREKWFMPEDISKHANLTDTDDIRQAKAGADWYCGYCGSTQRRLDGECANCGGNRGFATEDRKGKAEFTDTDDKWTGGKSIEDDTPSTPVSLKSYPHHGRIQWDNPVRKRKVWPFVAVGLGVIALVGFIVWLFTPRYVDATVVATHWTSTVKVERYQVIHDEGWDAPSDAFNVTSEERVRDHKRVQDGTESKQVTSSSDCGEDCTTVKGSCYTTPRECTPNDNGTASCTGGDYKCDPDTESCTARTCWIEVPKYKEVPIMDDWYSWSAWRWRHNRNVVRSGDDLEPLKPTDENIALNRHCSNGEKERTSIQWEYITTFSDGEENFKLRPKSEHEFKSLPKGTQKTLKITPLSVSIKEKE